MKSEREQFIRRIGVYLAGIAIGCVILGLFHQAREAEAMRQAAAREAAADTASAPASSPAGAPSTAQTQAAPAAPTVGVNPTPPESGAIATPK
ncbi:MAG: hypothetical protein SFY96_06045 [Planctomycetota bacterium]|nr:hypothetical protein [Planctomycetota bacterium]